MSVIRELADIAQRTSVLLGFDTPDSFLSLLQKMLEVSDPPGKVIEDVRAELHRQETEVGNTLRTMLDSPPPTLFPCGCQGELKTTRAPCPNCIRVNYSRADQLRRATQLEGVPAEDKPQTPLEQELAHVPRLERSGPPPTHLAPMVRLSDKPPLYPHPNSRAISIARGILEAESPAVHQPGALVVYSRAAHAFNSIVLQVIDSEAGTYRCLALVAGDDPLRPVRREVHGIDGADLRAAPAGLRLGDTADLLLLDLETAGVTRFAPAHLTARRCSPTHLQLLDEGVVTADWWPSTGKARAAGPTTGVAAPHKIFTVDALVEWLKGL